MSDARRTIEGELNEFFGALRVELEAARQNFEIENRRSAPDFNVFGFIKPDENRLSDIIAALLNPSGTHGQSFLFLDEFLGAMGISATLTKRKFRVSREEKATFCVNPLRRLDILVEGDNWAIGIENKPWAGDQDNQIRDYIGHLSARYGDQWYVIYITPDGSAPTSIDPVELEYWRSKGNFKTATFVGELTTWLQRCGAACEALAPKIFLAQFRRYVESVLASRPIS